MTCSLLFVVRHRHVTRKRFLKNAVGLINICSLFLPSCSKEPPHTLTFNMKSLTTATLSRIWMSMLVLVPMMMTTTVTVPSYRHCLPANNLFKISFRDSFKCEWNYHCRAFFVSFFISLAENEREPCQWGKREIERVREWWVFGLQQHKISHNRHINNSIISAT